MFSSVSTHLLQLKLFKVYKALFSDWQFNNWRKEQMLRLWNPAFSSPRCYSPPRADGWGGKTSSDCLCCSRARVFVPTQQQSSSTAFSKKKKKQEPAIWQYWQADKPEGNAFSSGTKMLFVYESTQTEEGWRVQNKPASTNHSSQMTLRMWVNQSASASREPFMAINRLAFWSSFINVGLALAVGSPTFFPGFRCCGSFNSKESRLSTPQQFFTYFLDLYKEGKFLWTNIARSNHGCLYTYFYYCISCLILLR